MKYVHVILPLAIPQTLTYAVPESFEDKIQAGMRVQVEMGRKRYQALVCAVTEEAPEGFKIKPLLEVIDDHPMVTPLQLELWKWIAAYYMCTPGDVMVAALPNGLRTSYKPRTESYVRLHPDISCEDDLQQIMKTLSRAKKQEKLLLEFLSFASDAGSIEDLLRAEFPKKMLLNAAQSSSAIFAACVEKNIFEQVAREVGRLDHSAIVTKKMPQLSPVQQTAYNSIKEQWNAKDVVLLHGITASGKTELYVHLIAEQMEKGKQVLFLVPEIALTTQLIGRLQQLFGNAVGVYHSRYSDEERVEIYNAVGMAADQPIQIIVGARSSVLLPFNNLGLVIVDEEHESTFKQMEPAPRYHARDTAIMLAAQHAAKVVMGTATPAIETYYNAKAGKFGLVELSERFHDVQLPHIEVVDSIRMRKKKQMTGLFSQTLIDAIGETLAKNEQVILFQNRRGFSPFIQCADCGYIPQCKRCSVSLTYHKHTNLLMCHYCGYTQRLPTACPECYSTNIQTKGFGTEKIEEELQYYFPAARLARLDMDTTRTKHAFQRIISDFEAGKNDVLIGTQMVTKGLDFSNVSLVGILNADNLLNFPDFRAHERSFQLLTQVSGRAGRKERQGRVIIQTGQPKSPVIKFVKQHDYHSLFNLQLLERHEFAFPPYTRLISVNFKHTNESILRQAAATFKKNTERVLNRRLYGPFQPLIYRVQSKYITAFWIRVERIDNIPELKKYLLQQFDLLRSHQGWSNLDIIADVDPV
jgi:primosomal protein N' (replication factor Y)